MWFNIRILYQANIILEEVARQRSTCSCSPDTEVIHKMFKVEYFVNELEIVAENSDLVSGEHDTQRVGTTKIEVQFFS